MRLLKIIPAIAVVALVSVQAHASLTAEMDGMFNEMSNYTAPGVFETQRRGVISGGSYVQRSRIETDSLISAVPPSYDAGCGGIDLFGGSFSFINADRLIQLFRSVASNAKGYAFKIALQEMCPSCSQVIENLQKKVQQLNDLSMNSCQIAQGIVTDTTKAFQGSLEKENSAIAQTAGAWGDTFQSFFDLSDGNGTENAKQSAPGEVAERITGNLVWEALKQNNAENWWTYGDDSLLEDMMSLTGSIVVKPAETGSDGEGEVNPVVTMPALLDIKDFVFGSENAKVYRCTTDDCIGYSLADFDMRTGGLKKKIEDILLGSGQNPGLIHGMATLSGAPTAAQKGFVSSLPHAYGAILRRLAVLDEAAARQFVRDTSGFIALGMVSEMITDTVNSVKAAVSVKNHIYTAQLEDRINQVETQIAAEKIQLIGEIGDERGILARYEGLTESIRAREYASKSQMIGEFGK